MMNILHITHAEYADILNLRSEVEITGEQGKFDSYVMRRFQLEPYTEHHIHLVREIKRHENDPDEDRKWRWCPRCQEFTNVDRVDEMIYGPQLAHLSQQFIQAGR